MPADDWQPSWKHFSSKKTHSIFNVGHSMLSQLADVSWPCWSAKWSTHTHTICVFRWKMDTINHRFRHLRYASHLQNYAQFICSEKISFSVMPNCKCLNVTLFIWFLRQHFELIVEYMFTNWKWKLKRIFQMHFYALMSASRWSKLP